MSNCCMGKNSSNFDMQMFVLVEVSGVRKVKWNVFSNTTFFQHGDCVFVLGIFRLWLQK